MRRVLTIAMLGLLGASLASCSTSSASGTDLCYEYQALLCKNTFACQGGDLIGVYASEQDCTAKQVQKICNNASGITRCSPGDYYHQASDQACLAGMKTQTCADFLAGTNLPDACQNICTSTP